MAWILCRTTDRKTESINRGGIPILRQTRRLITMFLALMLSAALIASRPAMAESGGTLPQIDCSTARIPITEAIYDLFTNTYGMTGPAPICSKTHGAWLNLADGAADILFLIAPTEDEFAYFAEKGVDIEMKIYGYDGLVFIGNEANRVDNLTSDQIRSIYSGKIRNWNAIPGGGDADMEIYIRNPESGSQRLFENLVWAGYDMPDFQSMKFIEGEVDPVVKQRKKTITIEEDMGSITKSVMVNQYSIGFNIMSYIDGEFLNPSKEQAPQLVVATQSVRMRSGPGLNYKSVGTLSPGTALDSLDETSIDDRGVAWYKARHSSEGEVWVSSRYSVLDGGASGGLKLFSVDGYAPTTENFASGGYPFVTTSYVVIRADEPADSPARKLFDWIGTEESKALIEDNSTLSVGFSDSVVLRTSEGDLAQNSRLDETVQRLDRERLNRSDLYAFTQEEIAFLRQGVYALSGKAFWQEKYAGFFASRPWYAPTDGSDAELAQSFNEFQRENLALLMGYQKELLRANSNRGGQIAAGRIVGYDKGAPVVRGEAVLALQQALAAQGYLNPSDCDGAFGKKSADALIAYQTENGLTPSGRADVDTLLSLLG